MALVPIKPGDEKKPYYKYYLAGIKPNTKEDYDFLENGAWKERGTGFEFADRNLALTQKAREMESGLYPLNGGGYLTFNKVPLPHVTAEMMMWWSAWHTLDSLRYKCWNAEDHFDIELTPEDRARTTDESSPLLERTWGTVQRATESIHGGPVEPVNLYIRKPSEVGLDMSLLGNPDCRYLSVATATVGPMKVYVMGILADTPEGSEFRELYYFGYTVEDGKDISILPPADIPPVKVAAEGALMHNSKEYRNLDKILPELYEAYKGKPLEEIF